MSGTIALCLMAKDEAHVLQRLLGSCRTSIDRVILSDTGSTDGTPEVMEKIAADYDLPCEVHHHEWVNFGHNRTKLMEVSKGKADWLLLLDADWTLDGLIDRESLKPDMNAYDLRFSGSNDFTTRRLVSGHIDWRWVGSVHEYIAPVSETCIVGEVLFPTLTHHGDGATWDGDEKGKWGRYIEWLLQDWAEEESPRTAFYLAQTYADYGDKQKAAEFYRIRSEMEHGFDEERWLATMRLGVLTDDVAVLLDAFGMRPQRAEPLYHLSILLRLRGNHHAALMMAQRGRDIPYPERDCLFIDRPVYQWGLALEEAVSLWWCGHVEESYIAHKELLDIADQMPIWAVERVCENLSFFADE
jgi:hypothetical protein